MAILTDATLAATIRKGKTSGATLYATDGVVARGVGRLRMRAQAGAGTFYFRYQIPGAERDAIKLGAYSVDGMSGLTLKAARIEADALSKLYQAGHHNLRAYIAEREAATAIKAATVAKETADAIMHSQSKTLSELCDAYAANMLRNKQVTARQVKSILEKNVKKAFPVLAATRASQLTHRDMSAIISEMANAGHYDLAKKCRGALRAAYQLAINADLDPTTHSDLHGFNLTGNPVAIVSAKKLSAMCRPGERTLNESEMQAYLGKLNKRTGEIRDAVLLSLYLGGQRSAQLMRVAPTDVDLDAGEIKLLDGKGARAQPRIHLLPLTPRAKTIVARFMEKQKGKPYLFTSCSPRRDPEGLIPMNPMTMSSLVAQISKEMLAEGSSDSRFELSDIRRTCETMLARMGVSKEARSHVLSHGLGGVQNQHYDKYEYWENKLNALKAWDRKLRDIEAGRRSSNVVSIGRGR